MNRRHTGYCACADSRSHFLPRPHLHRAAPVRKRTKKRSLTVAARWNKDAPRNRARQKIV
jgi:hypothetical protein